jgi:hypothetical protein
MFCHFVAGRQLAVIKAQKGSVSGPRACQAAPQKKKGVGQPMSNQFW